MKVYSSCPRFHSGENAHTREPSKAIPSPTKLARLVHLPPASQTGCHASTVCIFSLLATVTSCIDLSVRIVTKSPKVRPLLIFSISLQLNQGYFPLSPASSKVAWTPVRDNPQDYSLIGGNIRKVVSPACLLIQPGFFGYRCAKKSVRDIHAKDACCCLCSFNFLSLHFCAHTAKMYVYNRKLKARLVSCLSDMKS